MSRFHDADDVTLDEDELVELVVSEAKMPADERSLDEAIVGLNAFDDEYGAFADDHAEL